MNAPDLQAMRAHAIAAAKRASRWVYLYRHNYAIGEQTIRHREPDDHTLYLTALRSWDYAMQEGCSNRTALVHLRKLVAAGVLTEQRSSGTCRFCLLREDAIAIGREIIAEGLPFYGD